MGDEVKTDEPVSINKSVGTCKWFNNKQGFGFITITSGDYANDDVFVHHSGINVSDEQYRYLVQGEYVEFVLTETGTGEHKWYASEISGMNGGKLMCETRNLVRKERIKHNDGNVHEGKGGNVREGKGGNVREGKGDNRPRPRGRGPRESGDIHVHDEEGTAWNLVRVNSRGGRGKGGRQGRQNDKDKDNEY